MKTIENIKDIIFRCCDIRGKVDIDIDRDVSYKIGKSYGSYIKRLGKDICVVGRDNRDSSEEESIFLINGILDTGIDVIDIGLVTTPMLMFTCMRLSVLSGIMVTAGNHPEEYNGFKIAFDKRGIAKGEMMNDFKEFTKRGDFVTGYGSYYECDIAECYIHLFKKSLDIGPRKIKAVLDLGYGSTTVIARLIYECFNVDFDIIHEHRKETNQYKDNNLETLKKKVQDTSADIGIYFDGDGDSIRIIDEQGNLIDSDMFMITIIKDIVEKVNNKAFLIDVRCSKSLVDEIIKLGAKPIWSKVGSSYAKGEINNNHLPFGGTHSGHFIFNDKFPGFDSGLYASLRIIEILSKTDKSLSMLLSEVPNYYRNEASIILKDSDKIIALERIKEYYKNKTHDIITVDGIRANFNDSWILARYSHDEMAIIATFEAKTEKRLEEVKHEFEILAKSFTKDFQEKNEN